MYTLELFSGTKSFSKVAERLGHGTLTIDNDPGLNPDICASVLDISANELGVRRHVIWASPPCTSFSVAAIGHHWGGGYRAYVPKTDAARLGQDLVLHTIKLIRELKPTWWFIENPRGVLRKMPFMNEWLKETGGVRHTVTYCQYGDKRMKPTDIWTNATWWKPRPVCKNGDPCHESAPRGARTGTQGIDGARDRGRIPAELFEEIFSQMPVENKAHK